jgi:hypothetical protein
MVSKIAEKLMSKNKSFLVLELRVAQLLLSQTCSTKFLHVLTKQNRRRWQPTSQQPREKVYRVLQQQLCQAIAGIYVEL